MTMPDWLEPMAATLTQDRFSGADWLFERRFDGIRLMAYKRGAEVRLFSRNRLPQQLPALAQAIADLPVDEVILDGEVAWVGALFVSHAPDRLTQEFSKADRKGRIYVDTGRNGYSATFAAPYTVRARGGAGVGPVHVGRSRAGPGRPDHVHAPEPARSGGGPRRCVGWHAAPRALADAADREAAPP